MKKLIALLLVLVMVLPMAACGKKQKPAETEATLPAPTAAPTVPTTVPTTAPTEAPTKPTEAPTKPTEPAPTKAPVNPPFITKDPTSETVTEGDNAYFVAKAEDYDYIEWYIFSPDHKYQYSTSEAPRYFKGLSVAGDNTTQLILCNCPTSLDGWCVEATFVGEGGKATTKHCYVYVNEAKTPLTASPSKGTFDEDLSIKLKAGAGDNIYYELEDYYGTHSDTIKSGEKIILPAVDGVSYDAYLHAYVVGDKGNYIDCKYTMDCRGSGPQPDPEDPSLWLVGTYTDRDGNRVELRHDGYCAFTVKISIVGLTQFEGSGSYNNGKVDISTTAPNGRAVEATFDGSTLTFVESDWDLLEPGTTFGGF